jgi:hypothetical protein
MNLVVYSIVFMILAVIVDRQFASEDEDEQVNDEGSTEFDYKMLPDSDGRVEILPNKEGATVPQVYVGVPIKIQVV